MTFLIVEMFGFLLAALILGALAGWMLTRNRSRKLINETIAQWQNRFNEFEETRMQQSDEIENLTTNYQKLQKKYADTMENQQSRMEQMESENHKLRHTRSIMFELQEESKFQIENQLEKIAELESALAEKTSLLASKTAEAGQFQEMINTNDQQMKALNNKMKQIEVEENRNRSCLKADVLQNQAGNIQKINAGLHSVEENQKRAARQMTAREEDIKVLNLRIEKLENYRRKVQEIDDLKDIWGIARKLEKRLHELGIYSFKQLAQMKEEDVQWLSENIGPFKNRVLKDNWIEQAKKQYLRKYELPI